MPYSTNAADFPVIPLKKMLKELIDNENKRKKILELMNAESIEQIGDFVELSEIEDPILQGTAKESVSELQRLFELLDVMGVASFCLFDIGVVRGLAYYTGVVFEIYDKAGRFRAIGGGGRFDDLLQQFGGPAIPATGFGIGDCILAILLEEKGILKKQLPARKLDYFVACVDKVYREAAVKLTIKLRSAGWAASFSYKAANLSKQLKQASDQNARRCVIIGSEIENDQLIIKNMANGEQALVKFGKFLQQCQIESR